MSCKKAVVVGSGAGGATVAKELQGHFDVTILEAGREFRPWTFRPSAMSVLNRLHVNFDERLFPLAFHYVRVGKSKDHTVVLYGRGTGGTTTLSGGNFVRADDCLRQIGIDLGDCFREVQDEIPVIPCGEAKWRETTRNAFGAFADMGMQPFPMPKGGRYDRCTSCGSCFFGCPFDVKWDSRSFLRKAQVNGARLHTKAFVHSLTIRDGRANGVVVRRGRSSEMVPADLVLLAAGGMGTPSILSTSGISCQDRLFIDALVIVAAEMKGANQSREVTMPFCVKRDGFIISPCFDGLSVSFNNKWKKRPSDVYGLMIKIGDSNVGSFDGRTLNKTRTEHDGRLFHEGIQLCTEAFRRLGKSEDELFMGTYMGVHPGGMFPLGPDDAGTLHSPSLPSNCYVADASLFPRSLGMPPIMTIIALSKRISKICIDRMA